MLLAHLADLHLGYRQYYRQTAAGINQREADVARAFVQAVDQVIAKQPDVIVVAGDLFHAVRPTNQAIIHCFRQFQRIREALPAAKVLIAAGNHDTPRATETGSILKLFAGLGIEVATDDAAIVRYPDLDLAVKLVPHAALVADDRPRLDPEGDERYQVLVLHGDTPDLDPLDRWWAEPGGAAVDPSEFADPRWNYVALGHYHVMLKVGPHAWYSGALDYVTPNPWGELAKQKAHKVPAKGWLLVDLETRQVMPQYLESARRLIDLPPIEARDLAASEIDRAIQERLASIRGGYAEQLVRLVVRDVPRYVARELDHAAIRTAKATALHFRLDLRRPEVHRTVGVGAPGARQTLTDVLRGFLARRPLPERVDRDAFVTRGTAMLDAVSAAASEG
ncbi:MAG: DNA repair exonuclease [Gemmatimonadales bacterium]|nr:DNA repair exonuclease [Gemmatimonadales bacterium]